jgi:hypothetical protein
LQLAAADELEEKVNSSDFVAAFQGDLGPRIEAAAKALVALIGETVALVAHHSTITTDLMLAADRVGFRELYAGRHPLDIETGLARFREAVSSGAKLAIAEGGTCVDEYRVRYATGIRL